MGDAVVILAGTSEWTLEQLLTSRGGVEVWTARGAEDRRAIVKRLDGESATPERERLFKDEVDLLAALDSDHLPRLLDSGDFDGSPYAVITELAGQSLEVILRDSALPWRDALDVVIGVATAVDALHSSGVLHCDLKPEHVMIDGEHVALCDLGFARRTSQSVASSVGATPRYAAPEQLGLLRKEVQAPADLYALGLILCECLTGRPYWDDANDLASRLRSPVLHLPTEAPRMCGAILLRLLQADPAERYATCGGLLYDLHRLREGESHFATGTKDRRTTPASPAFVGREKELGELLTYISSPSEQVFRLGARSGRGKTRLLQEFEQQARSRGLEVFWGKAFAGESLSAATVWHSLLPALKTLLPESEAEWSNLANLLGDSATLLATAYPAILSKLGERTSLAPQMAGLGHALTDLLEALAQSQRLLLLFDDVQWADSLTLQWLQNRLPGNVWVVAAYRSDEVDANFVLSQRLGSSIEMPPLTDTACRELISSMIGPAPEAAMLALISRSQSEPFLLQALVRGAFESELLQLNGQGWHWTSDESVQTSLREGLELSHRLDLLEDDTRSVMECGALLGRRFHLQQTAHVVGQDLATVRSALQRAQGRHILWLDNEWGEFAHDKIRETLLLSVTAEMRRKLHSRAAEWLAHQSPRPHRLLAIQYHHSNRPELALEHALEGASDSLEQLDFDSASMLLQLAYDNLPADAAVEVRSKIARELGRSFSRQGRFPSAVAKLDEALEHENDAHARLNLIGELCYNLSRNTELKRSIPLIREGLEILDCPVPSTKLGQLASAAYAWLRFLRDGPRVRSTQSIEADSAVHAKARILRTAAEAWSLEGNLPLTLWTTARACFETTRCEPPAECSISIAHGALFSVMLGRPRLAERLFAQARTMAAGDPRYLGEILGQSSFVPLADGDLPKAIATFEEGVVVCRTQGDVWNEETARGFLSQLHQFCGNLPQARELAEPIVAKPNAEDTIYSTAARVLALIGDESLEEALLAKRAEWRGIARLESLVE